MIDKASGNPLGIKPINFQADDAKSEMKNLLAEAQLKRSIQGTPITEYHTFAQEYLIR